MVYKEERRSIKEWKVISRGGGASAKMESGQVKREVIRVIPRRTNLAHGGAGENATVHT